MRTKTAAKKIATKKTAKKVAKKAARKKTAAKKVAKKAARNKASATKKPAAGKRSSPAKARANKARAKRRADAGQVELIDRNEAAAAIEAAAPNADGKPPKFESNADVRLLVVDDEPEVLNMLVPFLRKKGYSVSEAEDGDHALEKILTDFPNIVLLDVNMPGLDGWQIAKYVRDRSYLKPVRIIMATGIGENLNAATAPLFRADAYLNKPFTLDEVADTVSILVDKIQTGAV